MALLSRRHRRSPTTLAPATAEVLRQFFGTGADAMFTRCLPIINRDPYAQIRRQLERSWKVFDFTDPNSDLCFCFILEDHPQGLTVRLSFVGPYAVILDPTHQTFSTGEVAKLVASAGFALLDRPALEVEVDLWANERGLLYEYLFEFDEGTPWDRSRGPTSLSSRAQEDSV